MSLNDVRLVGIGLLVALKNIGKYGGMALGPVAAIAGLVYGLGLLWRPWFHTSGDAWFAAFFYGYPWPNCPCRNHPRLASTRRRRNWSHTKKEMELK